MIVKCIGIYEFIAAFAVGSTCDGPYGFIGSTVRPVYNDGVAVFGLLGYLDKASSEIGLGVSSGEINNALFAAVINDIGIGIC